jgi:hypothetical protein
VTEKITYQELVKEYSNFLKNDIPEFDIPRKSFLECSGLNYKELVNSNLLEFYFNPDEQHKFGDVFLQSLLSFLDDKTRINVEDKFEKVEVVREQSTESGRIDLLINGYLEDNDDVKSVIIIENKIYHTIGNPFDDYWNSVREVSNKYKVGVLLTLKPEKTPKNFINITHLQLINRVLMKIGSRISDSDDRHLLFLKDYKLTINNLTKPPKMDDSLKFMYDNGRKITDLIELQDESFQVIKDESKGIINELNNYGLFYKMNSSNSYSFSINCYDNDIVIKHYVWYNDIFSEKEFSIHTYSSKRDNGGFGKYFDENRNNFSHLDKSGELTLDNVEKWSGSTIFGEYHRDGFTFDEILNFGEVFKDIFIKKVIPFEKELRKEIRKFMKNK